MPRTIGLFVLGLALPVSVPAQQPHHPVPPGLQGRIALAVARTWGVDRADLVLSWGSGSLAAASDSSPFRLLGGGEGGWFAVLVEPPNQAPIAIRLRAGRNAQRPVAARAVASGQALGRADIRHEAYVHWGPPAAAPAAVEAGWVARRRLAPGAPLDERHVGPAPVVAAGQPVRVHWQAGGVTVAVEGVALHAAAMGDPLRVRTTRKRGILVATVTAPGEARMN